MKRIKLFEDFYQNFESEDFVIALPNFPIEYNSGHQGQAKKLFVTTNVGKVISCSKEMIRILYDINPNCPENGYITDYYNMICSDKKYFRFATKKEIMLQDEKNIIAKYNI
jgi:hypothetical protein